MLEIKHLSKIYKSKNNEVKALDDINLKIQDKGMVFILGKSGSGKSTLLNVLGGLDQFTQGEMIICGKSSRDFKQSDFDSYRNTFIGFIFQEYNVMDNFTVKENIALALELQGKKADSKIIQDILKEVDLQDLGDRKPNELSGGQLQRVAIARALIKNPEIIMADEPTGALDSRTGKQVFDTLKRLSQNKLVLIVSHDKEFAKNYADRIIELADGKIISDTSKEHIAPTKLNDGVSYLEDEFMNIEDSSKLTDEDIQKIINEIKKHQGETIISFNNHTNQEIKKANHIDDQGRLEVFHNTTDQHIKLKDYARNTITFIKSKLPFHSSMKIALSNLKLKPFRLFITIILSVVSFTLFGLTNTLSHYNKEVTTFNSMKDSEINYISIGKTNHIIEDNYTYDEDTHLQTNDYQLLQQKYPSSHFINTFSNDTFGTDLDCITYIEKVDKFSESYDSLFQPTSLSALACIDQDIIDQNNFTLTGSLPQKDNEIVITEHFASIFKNYGYQTVDNKGNIKKYPINSTKDMISKTLTLMIHSKEVTFKITGILDTHIDLSRYEPLKEEGNGGLSQYYLSNELSTLLNAGYHQIGYVNNQRFQDCIDNYHVYSTQTSNQYMNLYMGEDDYYPIEFFYHYQDVNKDNIIDFNNGGSFYVNYHTIKNIHINKTTTLQDYVYQNTEDPENEKEVKKVIQQAVLKYQKEIISSKLSLSLYATDYLDNIIDKVAGVYISDFNQESHEFVLKDALIEKYGFSSEGYANFVIAPMCDDSTLQDIISYTYDDGIQETSYTLNNQVMPMLRTVNSAISVLKNVFFYTGIGFAVFASIMFCNFIATSIANKKREIGILRAVGARGLDVLKIFLNESLMIAMINWILSTIVCFIGTTVINQYIRNEFNVLVTILDFGFLQIILLLVISVGVACIASALPVYQISKKKPIDAIKDRK